MIARRRGALATSAMIFSGAILALVPAVIQASAARLFDPDEQALIAISLGLGAFISVVVSGTILESRLADLALEEKTYIPLWVFFPSLLGSIMIAITPTQPVVTAVFLPLIMTGLQVGRVHAVISGLWKSELCGAVVLASGSLVAFYVSLNHNVLSLSIVALAAGLVIVIRQIGAPARAKGRPAASRMVWVGSETAVVAATPFVMNVAILALLGPAHTIAFRLILTVLGVLQPLLGYLRIRLLGKPSFPLTLGLSVLSAIALGGVLLSHLLGAFDYLFGSAWEVVTLATLALACLWKLFSIPEAIPFARMRRRGLVSRVFAVRALSTLAYLALGILAASAWSDTSAVFAAFSVAALLTLGLYLAASRSGGGSRNHRER